MENSRLSQFGLQPKQWRSETEPDLPQGYVHIRSALRALLMAEHDAAYIEHCATSRNLVARALKEFRTMEAGTVPSADEVRHELIMLSDLGVFDNLAYTVEENDVTLVPCWIFLGDQSPSGREVIGCRTGLAIKFISVTEEHERTAGQVCSVSVALASHRFLEVL